MIYETITTKEFFPIWKKYRPVILKLMVDSLEGEQQEYKLSGHEFADVNTRKSATYSFKMELFEGRASRTKKTSIMASDLLAVLRQSGRAMELMQSYVFFYELDSQFNFRVRSEKVETEADSDSEETE